MTVALLLLVGTTSVAIAAAPATTQTSLDVTRITLKLDNASPKDALQKLFDQAHIPTASFLNATFLSQMDDVRVTCDLVDQPFGVALVEVCRQCRLEPEQSPAAGEPTSFVVRMHPLTPPHPSTRPTTRNARPAVRPPVSVSNGMKLAWSGKSWVDSPVFPCGPMTIVPRSAHRASVVNLEGSTPTRELTMEAIALRDPKLRLFAIADHVVVDEAVDDQGNSLVAASVQPAPPHLLSDSERSIWPITIPLAYVEGPRTLKHLRGRLAASVVSRSEPIDLIRDGKLITGAQKVGDVRYTVDKVEDWNEGIQIRLTFDSSNPNGGTQESWDAVRALLYRDMLIATDGADGLYWVNSMVYSWRQNQFYDGFIRLRPYQAFRNDPMPPRMPKRLTWNVPQEIEDVSIPVELKDLPLP